MTYAPINIQAYVNSYAGAIAGMAVSGWIVNPTSTDYAEVSSIAGAFAEAFDLTWNNATTLTNLEVQAIQSICQQEFKGRGVGPLNNSNLALPANWLVPAAACAALVLEADVYFAGQGINPGTPGGGGVVDPVQNTRYWDPTFVGTANGSIAAPFTLLAPLMTEMAGSNQGWLLYAPPGITLAQDAPVPALAAEGGLVVQGIFPDMSIVATPWIIEAQTLAYMGYRDIWLTTLQVDAPGVVQFNFENCFVDSVVAAAGLEGTAVLRDTTIIDMAWPVTDNFTVKIYGGGIAGNCSWLGGELYDANIGGGMTLVLGNAVTRFIGCTFQGGTIDNTNTPTLEMDSYSYATFIQSGVVFTGTVIVLENNTNPAIDLTVYVRKGGSNVTGDGSFNRPFATINAACALIRSFANGSTTNRYTVIVGTGRYTETLLMSDWTYIVGDSCEGTRVTFSGLTLGPEWTTNVDHRAGFQSMTVSGSRTVNFDAVSSNQGKLRFDNVTFNDKWTFTAFSAINQVILNDCFMFDGYIQNGINCIVQASSIQGNVAMNSISDGRNLPTLAAFVGTGLSSLTQNWTASAGANAVTSSFQGTGMTGLLTLNGAQATVDAASNPIAFPGGVTLLASAPDPRRNLTGAKAGNVALASVCTQLAASGGYLNSTT